MKWLALASATVLAALLTIIGFTMVGPGGPNSYVWPVRVGAVSLIALPIGYWLIAIKRLPPMGGVVITAAMGAIAAALWLPLFRRGWMLETHGGVLVIWTALWGVASLPFMRVVAKKLRKPRR